MRCDYACGTADHTIARRQFLGNIVGGAALGGLTAGGLAVGGLGIFAQPATAAALQQKHKRVVVFWMAGGLSQLESWDPKPGTATGGPFRAIPTSVPGLHISELLPLTAKQMHHLAVVRGVNTNQDDHGVGTYMMVTGRKAMQGVQHPWLGAVVAKSVAPEDNPLPGYINITPGGGGRGNDAAYLGPKYASLSLGNGQPPAHTVREGLSPEADQRRHDLRRKWNDHFAKRRRTAETDAYMYSYEQALRLMERRDAFDVTKEPVADQEKYGKFDLGRHCLLARRLLEQGATFVQVTHSNYDTHNENFDFHIEQLGEFDRAFATFVEDLHQRGMLESTLVVVMSEFGRTPNINHYYGRDHWSRAWSVVLGGGGIQAGAVLGKTNHQGTEVVDRQVDHGNLFHTFLRAVGVDSSGTFTVAGQQMPIADPASGPIKELLK